jgi:hypothetical protein
MAVIWAYELEVWIIDLLLKDYGFSDRDIREARRKVDIHSFP